VPSRAPDQEIDPGDESAEVENERGEVNHASGLP
jgi:hypothetical protein